MDFTIGITNVFSCINICRVPRKLFEHEAAGWVFKHLPGDPANVSPSHCGRHLGKIHGPKPTYVKVWRCTSWWITLFLTGKSWIKIVLMSSWGIWLAYPGIKILATAVSILLQTARLVIGRCFKLSNSPCLFECRAVTSPTTLVSKGHH